MILEVRDKQMELERKVGNLENELKKSEKWSRTSFRDVISTVIHMMDFNSFFASATMGKGMGVSDLRVVFRKSVDFINLAQDETKELMKWWVKIRLPLIMASARAGGVSSEEFIRALMREMGLGLIKNFTADEKFMEAFKDIYGSEAANKLKSLVT